MTPSDFSVLLLAWDDADPSVAVLGGAALPPTLPLVYHLAAEQSVLALYPHLPADAEELAGKEPAAPAAAAPHSASQATAEAEPDAAFAAPEILAEETAAPEAVGVRRLMSAASEETPAFTTLLVGLDELAAPAGSAEGSAQLPAALPAPKTVAPASAGPARSQWPTGANAPQRVRWAAPAAPYVGASAPAGPSVQQPVAPLVPASSVREAADLAQAALSRPSGFSPLAVPAQAEEATGPTATAPDLNEEAASDSEPTTARLAEALDEPQEEMGAAEAGDLAAPEDNLTLEASAADVSAAEPAVENPAAALQIPAAPEAELSARLPAADGLNFRMIQYARQAAQLVHGRTDFEVIYAPNWPAWLAAVEIRNRSRLPLVLYAGSLASDFGPHEGGWLLEVERMALRRARLVLVPSEAVRQQLQQRHGAEASEVRVVPAADEAAVQAVLREVAAG
ncbi:glycosyltransferase [Hymenobacter sp. BT523]|uniref:glycosyltransferase family 4 protein n=1 Tax=Hymenobacter sp. BT523 TaxID=2795725 RepID=UPI0018EAF9BD|nr:glycosyltransferase family 4 protein [Hymenobacter sp. BT523]MBJ6110264.1 glycosyltransferase [Hymenobacter sp. BT523]